jgi:hypothetical protein
MSFHVPEKFRIIFGPLKSGTNDGNNGAFTWRTLKGQIRCIASDQEGWEHVSVSLENRCPTWAEMCLIKNLFWDEEDCVVQFHPPKSMYVNNHKYCLHLFRPIGQHIPRPPSWMVGVK